VLAERLSGMIGRLQGIRAITTGVISVDEISGMAMSKMMLGSLDSVTHLRNTLNAELAKCKYHLPRIPTHGYSTREKIAKFLNIELIPFADPGKTPPALSANTDSGTFASFARSIIEYQNSRYKHVVKGSRDDTPTTSAHQQTTDELADDHENGFPWTTFLACTSASAVAAICATAYWHCRSPDEGDPGDAAAPSSPWQGANSRSRASLMGSAKHAAQVLESRGHGVSRNSIPVNGQVPMPITGPPSTRNQRHRMSCGTCVNLNRWSRLFGCV